jgi:hypothetical protein
MTVTKIEARFAGETRLEWFRSQNGRTLRPKQDLAKSVAAIWRQYDRAMMDGQMGTKTPKRRTKLDCFIRGRRLQVATGHELGLSRCCGICTVC